MPEHPHFHLRVFFQKKGRLALLSHLELARALERTVRRAALPYAVSAGFSPHMKIAFGSALPVGVGGDEECFDVQLTSYVAPEKVLEALARVSVGDLMVSAVYPIGNKVPAASVAYPLSVYEAKFFCAPRRALLPPETITVVRKSKEKELVVADFLEGDMLWEDATLTFSLWSKPTGSLRVDLLVESIAKQDETLELISLTRIHQHALLNLL
ncbi:MAG: TIGR03936 family radical SAM-associated protein [Eggerthellaceae bacterium]|nr:TIGR03936 family radical SAM-associated protein [Eggerthellaceae bacterium]